MDQNKSDYIRGAEQAINTEESEIKTIETQPSESIISLTNAIIAVNSFYLLLYLIRLSLTTLPFLLTGDTLLEGDENLGWALITTFFGLISFVLGFIGLAISSKLFKFTNLRRKFLILIIVSALPVLDYLYLFLIGPQVTNY